MDHRHDILHFIRGRLLPVLNWPAVSLLWSGTVMVIWCFLGNSSNGQIAVEPAAVLTFQVDPSEYDPFTPEIAYSPAGKFIASWKRVSIGGGLFGFGGSSTTSDLKIWNVVTGNQVLSYSEPFIQITYSPHEDVALITGYTGTTVYSLKDGQNIAQLSKSGHSGMWFSQNGEVLLAMSVLSSEEQAPSPEVTRERLNSVPVVHIKAFSTTAWQETPHFVNQIGPLYFWASVSRSKKFIASFVENDDGKKTMKIWDLSNGEPLPSPDVGHPDFLFEPEFVCNDQVLLIPDVSSQFPTGNRLWHIEKGQWLEQREYIYPSSRIYRHLLPFSASPALTVDVKDSLLTVRDLATGEIKNPLPRMSGGRLYSAEFINNFPFDAGSHLLNDHTLVLMSPRTRRGELRICDLQSGVERSIDVPTPIRLMACSKDGRLVAIQTASSADTRDGIGNRIELWDTIDGRRKYEAKYPERVSALALSPDHKLLVAASGCYLCLIGTDTHNEIGRIQLEENETTDAMCFSGDGKLLYALSRGRIQIWSVDERRKLHTYEVDGGNQLTLSQDGTRLAAWSSGADRSHVFVIDSSDGHLISKSRVSDYLQAVFFSAQHKLVGITQEFSAGGPVHYYASKVDFATSKKTTLEGVKSIGRPADAWSNRIAFDPKSGAIAVSSIEPLKSDSSPTVHVFGLTSGDRVFQIGGGEVFSLAFVNDAKSLIMGIAGGEEWSLDFIDLLDGTVKTALKNHRFIAASRSGKYFATQDYLKMNTVLWHEYQKTKVMDLPNSINLQFSPDDETFATADKGVVNVWSIQNDALHPATAP